MYFHNAIVIFKVLKRSNLHISVHSKSVFFFNISFFSVPLVQKFIQFPNGYLIFQLFPQAICVLVSLWLIRYCRKVAQLYLLMEIQAHFSDASGLDCWQQLNHKENNAYSHKVQTPIESERKLKTETKTKSQNPCQTHCFQPAFFFFYWPTA